MDLWFSPDRFLVAALALVLSSVIGLATRLVYPIFWGVVRKLFGGIIAKLDNDKRPMPDLVFRGFMVVVIVMVLSAGAGVALTALSLRYPFFGLFNVVGLSAVIASGGMWRVTNALYTAMKMGKAVDGAYGVLSRALDRDLNRDDEHGIVRKVVALNVYVLTKGLIAPLFWYVVGGLPAAYAYAGLAGLMHIFMHDHPKPQPLSAPAYAAERAAGTVPHLVSAIIIGLAAILTPTASFLRPLLLMRKSGVKASYYQGGLPLNMVAWSLKVTLNQPFARAKALVWIGPRNASAQIGVVHLRRMLVMHIVASLWLLVFVLAGYTLLY